MRGFKKLKFKVVGGQKGLASIVVTGVLVALLSLIAVSFALVMRRELDKSVTNQTAQAAYYAAESGINDAASYLQTHPNTNVTNCNGLIGSGKPLANSAQLSSDGSTKYTCVLVNTNPSVLTYQSISSGGSKVVELNAAAKPSQLMISWQPTSGSTSSFVPAAQAGQLFDETTWASANYPPLLEATIYPIPADTKDISYAQANQKTFFLYPSQAPGTSVATVSFAAANGYMQTANCGATDTGTFSGTADYNCNTIVTGLPSGGNGYYFYIELAPYYGNADVKLKADSTSGSAIQFTSTQAVIDVTATSGSSLKRLQATVDLNSSQDIQNIADANSSFPQQALRSAFAICKRLQVPTSGAVYIDSTSQSECGNVPNLPQPTPPTPPTPIMLNAYLTDGGVGGNKILNLAGTVNDHSVAGTKAWFHYVECGSGNDVAQYFYSSPGGQPQSVPVNDNDNPISLSVNPFSFYYCGYNPTSNFQMCAQVPGGDPVCSVPYFITSSGGGGGGGSSSGGGGGSSGGGGGGSCQSGIDPSSDTFTVTGNCGGLYYADATYSYCYAGVSRQATFDMGPQAGSYFSDQVGDAYSISATGWQGDSKSGNAGPWSTGYSSNCSGTSSTSSSSSRSTSSSSSGGGGGSSSSSNLCPQCVYNDKAPSRFSTFAVSFVKLFSIGVW